MPTTKKTPPQWSNVTVRLGDLKPWERNPRTIVNLAAERLVESFEEFGQVESVAIGPFAKEGKAPVYNGHQRLTVLLEQHGPDFTVDARQSSRALTEKEREKLTAMLHRGATGDWDWDILLSQFDHAELLEWGFDEQELGLGRSNLSPDFAEYDESIEQTVEMQVCPNCGQRFPK